MPFNLEIFEDFLREHFAKRALKLSPQAKILAESTRYSLFSGGKRFRPLVSALTAQTLQIGLDRILPWAAAIECIHTYSLIHDDLPCMDNDHTRRGQPTNHIQFGETTALLAGDALLTEAFFILSEYYRNTPEVAVELTRILSDLAGYSGMVAGQVEDLVASQKIKASPPASMTSHEIDNGKKTTVHGTSIQTLIDMHTRKTGGLIKAAAEGVAVIARVKTETRDSIADFGAALGLAFQVADDILDYNPKNIEASGLPKHIGLEATETMLHEITDRALSHLQQFGREAQELRDLINFNLQRKK